MLFRVVCGSNHAPFTRQNVGTLRNHSYNRKTVIQSSYVYSSIFSRLNTTGHLNISTSILIISTSIFIFQCMDLNISTSMSIFRLRLKYFDFDFCKFDFDFSISTLIFIISTSINVHHIFVPFGQAYEICICFFRIVRL